MLTPEIIQSLITNKLSKRVKSIVENNVKDDPKQAFWYAWNVLKGPFPAGEPAIVKDPELAFRYALHVLQLSAVAAKAWGKNKK